jgi:hypothetical protein
VKSKPTLKSKSIYCGSTLKTSENKTNLIVPYGAEGGTPALFYR